MRKSNFFFLFIYLVTVVFLIFGAYILNFRMFFISLITIILFLSVEYFEKLFKLEISFFLKLLLVLFIFSAQVLGEILNFYSIIGFWDCVLHFLSGFISACFGLGIICFFNMNNKERNVFSVISFIFVICFAISVSVIWEFFEFGMDKVFGLDMQKDEYVDDINTMSFGEFKYGMVRSFDEIQYVDIYYNEGVYRFYGGYLDIGLYDTISDMFFNLMGSLFFGVLYLINSFKGKFFLFEVFRIERG